MFIAPIRASRPVHLPSLSSLRTPKRLNLLTPARAMSSAPVKTFANQDKLPRLPVPDLEKSLEGYLKSLIPLLEQKVRVVHDSPEADSSMARKSCRKSSKSVNSSSETFPPKMDLEVSSRTD
jgi:hypothetical protein